MRNTNIDQCIKCSICNAYCPVLQATGLFPGPKLSGPDAERFRQEKNTILPDWLEHCAYCKICEMVCPHDVPIPELHIRSRMAWRKKAKPSFRDWLLGHSYFIGRLGSWAAPLSNLVVGRAFFRWLLDRGLGIDHRAQMPLYRRQTFEKWFQARRSPSGQPLAYFYGCYTNYFDPTLGQAVVEVLEKNGFRLILPPQECCGLPLLGNGLYDLAAKLGEKNLKSLKKNVAAGIEVVFSSPSCGMTLKQEYERILNLPEASSLTEHLIEISQFLLQLHEEGSLNLDFKKLKDTYYYHVPCHLRALRVGLPAMELLSLIPGLKIIELPEGCCGLAGTYGFKREKYAVAREVGDNLFKSIQNLKAKMVISDCEACRMQISHHTGVKTFHPLQILRRAYRE